jgi:hypothetical protein
MCAVCFTAAEMVPAMAAAGRAMLVKRGMRKLNDEAASLEVEAAPAPPEAELAEEEPALSAV